jgi:Bacterial Ig-like domain (group 3)
MTRLQFLFSLMMNSCWSRIRTNMVGLLAVLLGLIAWVPCHGQAQSSIKAPAFRQGSGDLAMAPLKVPFKPGPFGPDGKVHFLPPLKKVLHPESEIEQAEKAKERANAGMADLTTKPFAKVLSEQELKALKWDFTKMRAPNSAAASSQEGATNTRAPRLSTSGPAATTSNTNNFFGLIDTGYFPPDGGVAAGHVDLVEVVNDDIAVFDKSGFLLSVQYLSDLFASVGTPAQDNISDPRVIYDPDTERFFVLVMSWNDSPHRSNLLLAVSNADDVTQGWTVYAFDATLNGNSSSGYWCDQPYLGIDAVAIYMSCNMYAFPFGSSNYQYSKIRIMTKEELVSGPCCSWWDVWDIREGFLNLYVSATVRPAVMHFSRDTDGDFWIDAGGQGGSDDTLHVWHVTNAANCCNGTGGPTISESDEGVGSYGAAPDAVQPNGASPLDTGDTRVLYVTWEYGHLSVGQNIACSQGGVTSACSSFTEIDTTSYPSMSNVNDWVWGGGTGENVFYPYVDQNSNADKTMVYTRSDATSTYPGAYSVNIPHSAVCTNCISAETTLSAGTGNYVLLDSDNKNRWGDYMGAGADPDFLGVWVEGEFSIGGTQWGTEIMATYNTYAAVDSPSPTSLNFGNQAVFSESAPQTVTFTSLGSVPLSIDTIGITGNNGFLINSDDCSGVRELPNGGSCQVSVAFSPTSTGSLSATLNVPDNTPAGMTTVALSGIGAMASTTTALRSSLNPSSYHQTVHFTATVTPSAGGPATGSVTLKDGATSLATSTLAGGKATFTVTLAAGTHSMTAVYAGNSTFAHSTSGELTEAVDKAATTTKIASSPDPSNPGQAVTFAAMPVGAYGGFATGKVVFKNGTHTMATVAINPSTHVAKFTTSTLLPGTYSIVAGYLGDANFKGSISPVLKQLVK